MLNLIPALLLLLASSPFGSASVEALAQIENSAHVSRNVLLVQELELAGLTKAQAILVIASCEETSTDKVAATDDAKLSIFPDDSELVSGHSWCVRFRDGPAA